MLEGIGTEGCFDGKEGRSGDVDPGADMLSLAIDLGPGDALEGNWGVDPMSRDLFAGDSHHGDGHSDAAGSKDEEVEVPLLDDIADNTGDLDPAGGELAFVQLGERHAEGSGHGAGAKDLGVSSVDEGCQEAGFESAGNAEVLSWAAVGQ